MDIKTGNIQITGLADLEKRLLAFPDKLAGNILGGAIRAGAVVIQREAQAKAPMSNAPHYLTSKRTAIMKKMGNHYSVNLIQPGTLKKSIRVKKAPRKSRSVPIEYWVYVSKRIWYWKFVEFGTSKMVARPFMRPAFDIMKEKATERIREYLAARIDKEAAKS